MPPDPWADGAVIDDDGGLRAPIVAHWAVTYRCNLSCAFCYAESGPDREPEPHARIRRRIVERLAAWGVFEVALGGGEPTLLPDFADLLAAIRDGGMVPNVTTNGTIHRPEVVAALAEHAGVVHLSADRPDRLDAARGRASSPGSAGRRKTWPGPASGWASTCCSRRRTCMTSASAWRRPCNLGARHITLLRPKGEWARTQWPGFPSADDFRAMAEGIRAFLANRPPVRLYVDTALRGEWAELGLFEDPEPEVAGCGGGQRHVAVTPEGDVFPCSHARCADYRMGNLLTECVDRIWSQDVGRRCDSGSSGLAEESAVPVRSPEIDPPCPPPRRDPR